MGCFINWYNSYNLSNCKHEHELTGALGLICVVYMTNICGASVDLMTFQNFD